MGNKKILGVVAIAVIVIMGLFLVLVMGGDDKTSKNMSPESSDAHSGNSGIVGSKASDNPETVEANEVEIKDFSFQSQKIQIKKGTTVTWTNRDEARHDVTPDNPSDAFRGSELLEMGESYSFTFNEVGEYSYICSPHPYMVGTVVVVE